MNLLQALLTILPSALVCIFPGIAYLNRNQEEDGIVSAARMCVISLVTCVLVTLIVAFAHLPLLVAPTIIVALTLIGLSRKDYIPFLRLQWKLGVVAIAAASLYVLFSIPFIYFHQGLPTGDSQKAMYFGQQVIATRSLPDYSKSPSLLNRDPVDFYTPGLHTLTAMVMDISPYPYFSVGFLSIAVSIALVVIGAGIALTVHAQGGTSLVITTAVLITTNIRFLRYVREPGYHLQNIVGEVLLFGFLLFSLSLLRKFQKTDALVALVVLLSLVTVHQFSTFLAAFIALPLLAIALWHYRTYILTKLPKIYLVGGIILLLVSVVGVMYQLDLGHKLQDLFTSTPHLTSYVPSFFDYFSLMGISWMAVGLVGLVCTAYLSWKQQDPLLKALVGSTFVLLLLTQGPRIYIDIPAVRALFYTVIPLSVLGALAFEHITKQKKWMTVLLIVIIAIIPLGSSVVSAFTLSHTVRTNATLTAGIDALIQNVVTSPQLKKTDAVLVDSYNRQSLTWLLMTGQPTFNRVASDLERGTQESSQSSLRHTLYLHQLDFEKIYSLGSLPLVNNLLDAYHIRFLAGVEGSSKTAFDHNLSLDPIVTQEGVTLYGRKIRRSAILYPHLDSKIEWLLSPSTILNDIGDDEDTFEHLPVSIRSTRLSSPKFENEKTFRTTTAPVISLNFNISDYVGALWMSEGKNIPSKDVELLIDTLSLPTDASIVTANGAIYPFPKKGETVSLKASDVALTEKGFITLSIMNPKEVPISFDIVALGLSSRP